MATVCFRFYVGARRFGFAGRGRPQKEAQAAGKSGQWHQQAARCQDETSSRKEGPKHETPNPAPYTLSRLKTHLSETLNPFRPMPHRQKKPKHHARQVFNLNCHEKSVGVAGTRLLGPNLPKNIRVKGGNAGSAICSGFPTAERVASNLNR